MSPQILSLIVFAENIHLNLNRPTKIAVCGPGFRISHYMTINDVIMQVRIHNELHNKGPYRPDAIRQRDANFQFLKQIKPSTDKNFTRYADQIAKIA